MIIICRTIFEADLGKPSGVHKDIAYARYLVSQDLAFACATYVHSTCCRTMGFVLAPMLCIPLARFGSQNELKPRDLLRIEESRKNGFSISIFI